MGMGVLFVDVKRQDEKLTTHSLLVPSSRMVDRYDYSLIRLHGVALN
jgi:hypothetical protein